MRPSASTPSDYAELRKIVIERGLLKRQPGYFILKMIVNAALLAIAIALLPFVDRWWLVPLVAALFSFVQVQIGLLGHDAGHRQIFAASWKDSIVSYVCSFVTAISAKRWIERHNEHHAHPNSEEMDPDIDFPMLAFSENQARSKRGFFRFIVRHQAVLYFPFLFFICLSIRSDSLRLFLRRSIRETWLDILLFVLHFLGYFTLVFLLLSPLHAAVFILVHQGLFGLYLGLVFAPNHKGMPVLGNHERLDFVREQVLTSRNVRSNPLVDFWYGGLNFQIEHHLFPHMPRNKLRAARAIIKDFCAQRNIPYYETGVLRSYWEILTYMHRVGSSCRVSPIAG